MKFMAKKRLVIIDSNALIHRAYHALPPLSTKKGELVNAVYGFLLIFLKAIKDLEPEYITAVFDLPSPTFRHEKFDGYKANRPKAPDELYNQIPKVKKVLSAFNVSIFEKKGFEADDLIGTISKTAKKQRNDVEIIILSGDLDTLQLINDSTKVYTMRKGVKDTVLYDEASVEEKYGGLVPLQLIDFKSLRGDPSDNIPGVKGIGEKTATELIKNFGSLENLYKELERDTEKAKTIIKPRIKGMLLQQKETAFLSKALARIEPDVPLEFRLSDCVFGEYNRETISKILTEFEFYSLVSKIPEKGRKGGQSFLAREEPDEIEKQIEEFFKEGMFSEQVYQIEKDLVPVIGRMQKNGIKIDEKQLIALGEELKIKISKLEEEIHKLSGSDFNINSPQQLSKVLFQDLRISVQGLRKTPGGEFSTSLTELEKLKTSHEVISKVLKYRELFKLKSGFVDSLPKQIDPKDKRIHPKLHQLGTVTGRMSCSDPNLQNVPVRGELGKEIRKCFIPEKRSKLISADYSQMELRVVASVSKDEKMINFFKEGKDIHKMTASQIFNIPQEKVDDEMRGLAKTLNFGIIYGITPHGLAESAGIAFKEAKKFIDEYFNDFQGVSLYSKEAISKARELGYAETIFGRKRFLPEINSIDPRVRWAAERMAMNHPIQGSSADIMKMAMILCDKIVMQYKDKARMILQIHDELLFEADPSVAIELCGKIKESMENVVKLDVPLVVDTKIGDNWNDMVSFQKLI